MSTETGGWGKRKFLAFPREREVRSPRGFQFRNSRKEGEGGLQKVSLNSLSLEGGGGVAGGSFVGVWRGWVLLWVYVGGRDKFLRVGRGGVGWVARVGKFMDSTYALFSLSAPPLRVLLEFPPRIHTQSWLEVGTCWKWLKKGPLSVQYACSETYSTYFEVFPHKNSYQNVGNRLQCKIIVSKSEISGEDQSFPSKAQLINFFLLF